MIISNTAVKNSTTVMVLAVVLIIFGVYSYSVLPRESDPDITIPNVFVSTSYRGVSPADMETSVTIEIEKKLKGLDGVKKIHSVSSEGNSFINVEFLTGIDIDKALQDVKDKVDEASGDLPHDLENDPSVFEVNFSEMPIVVFSLSGTCGLPCLKRIADDIKDGIEGIPGILEVEVTGGIEREVRVEVMPEKLAYYGLSIADLNRVVTSENQNTSGGAIRLGDGRFQLRVPGEFKTPEEIYGLVVSAPNGRPIYLKDLATVVDGFKEETSRSRLDGRTAVNLMVKKRAGENIVSISQAIDQLIERQKPTWPGGTEITKVMNKAHDIDMMVTDLENNILSGLVLVMVVIFCAMGLRNAILVSLAIPFSMLLSFTVLYLMGITLNMVVLFSLTLALGMLVDNAIVIVENIYRYMEQGVDRRTAAMRATGEVAWPVIGSTLTTLAAFSPMLFWPGIMGEFMGFLPLTLIITLTASLFVALVINPAFASIFMKTTTKSSAGVALPAGRDAGQEKETGEAPKEIQGPFLRIYAWMLGVAMGRPVATVLTSFAVLALMVQVWLLVVGLEKPVEFFPDIQPKSMYVNVDLPEGADIDYIDRIMRRVEMAVAGTPVADILALDGLPPAEQEVRYQAAMAPQKHRQADGASFEAPSDLNNIQNIYMKAVATTGGGDMFAANAANHIGIRFIDLAERTEPTSDTLEQIRERTKNLPGGKITVASEGEGPPTGSPINIEISGDSLQVLGALAKQIKEVLGKVPHVTDVRDDFVLGTPSVRIQVDRQKAALFGLSTDLIGFALKTAYNGLDVSSFREGDEDYDITVQLAETDRRVTDVLRELLLPTPSGILVPLSTLATVEYTGGVGNIVRINHQRTVTVKANVDESKIPGPVARAEAESFLQKFPLPPGYEIKFTGEFEFQQESEAFLTKAFVVALLLIFLILVAQFNSVRQPFIIMTSVILSLGGAFLGLALYKQPFGIIMTGVGVISLAGVVVNNAIVLIDYTNKLRTRGMDLKEAVIAAGATRLRPVLLTAVTTVLGLVPMVTGVSYDFSNLAISWVSDSSQWWRSMAVVVIYGLGIATFLTLIAVPTLYYGLERFHERSQQLATALNRLWWRPYHAVFRAHPREKTEGTRDNG